MPQLYLSCYNCTILYKLSLEIFAYPDGLGLGISLLSLALDICAKLRYLDRYREDSKRRVIKAWISVLNLITYINMTSTELIDFSFGFTKIPFIMYIFDLIHNLTIYLRIYEHYNEYYKENISG